MEQELGTNRTRLIQYGFLLGKLHLSLHAKPVLSGLPDQKETLEKKIREVTSLAEPIQEKLIARLKTMPNGQEICHGDFHPGNIIIAPEGPVIIDWLDATVGNPDTDVVRTLLLLAGAAFGNYGRHALEKMAIWALRACYLSSYRKKREIRPLQIRSWMPIMAAARLNEQIPQEEDFL